MNVQLYLTDCKSIQKWEFTRTAILHNFVTTALLLKKVRRIAVNILVATTKPILTQPPTNFIWILQTIRTMEQTFLELTHSQQLTCNLNYLCDSVRDDFHASGRLKQGFDVERNNCWGILLRFEMSLGTEWMQQGTKRQGQSSRISKMEPEAGRSDPRTSPTKSFGSRNSNTT